jgi:5-methyltetrahydrofolate--homocysteine methyltransferase
MSALHELLSKGRPVVADGAWGTQLVKRGLGRQTPEAWNLEQPEQVAGVAADYATAGSQIVITNTFGGTSVKLEKAGLAGEHEAINRRGVELSRQGAAGRALVVPSMGPTGELVGFTSKLSEAEIEEVFRQQALALLAGEPDGLLIETVADLTEALCALRGAKSACDLPVVVSMTYDEGARGPASMMGVTPDRAAAELTAAGADLVGANCGRLSEEAWEEVVRLTVANTDRPIWVKANAGIPQLVDGQSVFAMASEAFAALGVRLVAAGATVMGGCCGTTPAHIAALAAALK